MDFTKLLKRRCTVRRFEQRPVSDEDLRFLLEAARNASSGANQQPLRYIVVRTPGLSEAILPLTAWAALVTPRRIPVAGVSAPPAWIAVHAPSGRSAESVLPDAGAAVQSMEFAAVERGLGCCWLGAIQREKIAELLALPQDRKLLYLVAVGYPAEEPLHEDAAVGGSLAYYLDDADTLHIPKVPLAEVAVWK